MRTQQEILDRIEVVKEDDVWGFQQQDLIAYLSYENAKPHLRESVTEEEWKKQLAARSPWGEMVQYMDFAWEKANGQRGLSAMRSMMHYMAWLWLNGDEELHKELYDITDYGKPQLEKICEYLHLDVADYKDC